VRDAVFGWQGWVDLAHFGVLLGFALLTWRLAVAGMTRKLID
jgi:lipooligosaccharide transport system permease protein